MTDYEDVGFEMGQIVLKTLRDLDASKADSWKLIRILGGSDEEEIVLQKIGKYWNKESRFDRPDGLVVVTNYRFVFLTKVKTVMTTTDYLSFPLEMIEAVESTRVMKFSPAIRFLLEGREYTFTFLSNADEAVDAVRASMESLSLSRKE